jgi:hypothetical protein
MAENDWPANTPDDRPPWHRPEYDQWDDAQGGPNAPPPKKMGAGMKACLIVGAIAGVCCLLCCGGIGYFYYNTKSETSSDPAKVDAARAEIAKIEPPAGFRPLSATKLSMFSFSMMVVLYANPAVDGHFSLMEMNVSFGKPADQERMIREQLDKQEFIPRTKLQDVRSETRQITIKGRPRTFTFITAKDPNSKKIMRQVQGMFPGNHGLAFLFLQMDDKAYKEDQIVKWLEGIQ